jgi:hypothetical protein
MGFSDAKRFSEEMGYRVCIADTEGRQREVAELINQRYSWRGYSCDTTSGIGCRTGETVFQVFRKNLLVATLTLRLDSQAGLMADQLYREEVDVYRRGDGLVCEMTGLAIAPGEDSKGVLGALFESAFAVGCLKHGATDLVIEVNPRHVIYYRRCLGFRVAGPERTCPRVGAPAVLLHLDLDDLLSSQPDWAADYSTLPFARRCR